MVVLTDFCDGADVLCRSDSAVGEGVGDLCACSLMGVCEGGSHILDGLFDADVLL